MQNNHRRGRNRLFFNFGFRSLFCVRAKPELRIQTLFFAGLFVCFALLSFVRAESSEWTEMGPLGGGVYEVAVHPTSLDTIYAGLEDGIFRSTNGGASWEMVPGLNSFVFEIVFDHQSPNVIFVGTSNGLFKSSDGGQSWNEVATFAVRSLILDPNNSARLHAGSYSGRVYTSYDGGSSWTESSTGSWGSVSALAVSPIDSAVIYAGTEGDFDFPGDGIYKTTDGGLTWQNVSPVQLHSNIRSLAIDPSNPLTVYAGTAGGGMYSAQGVFKSMDGGGTWGTASLGLPQWSSVNAMVLDSDHPQTLYVGMWEGLFKTTTGGSIWFHVDTGLDEGRIQSIDLFANNTNVLFVGGNLGVLKSTSGGEDLVLTGVVPVTVSSVVVDYLDSETIYTIGRGTYKTTDSGAHWQLINKGLPWVGKVMVQDPSNNQVLYAGEYSPYGAVYKTTNSGSTWAKTSLQDIAVNDIAVAPTNPSIVFAGGSSLFKSEDAGSTWTASLNFYTSSIAIDPIDPQTVYVAGHNGLRKTEDGGVVWFPIEDGLNLPASGYVLAVAVDPLDTDVVYCGTYYGGVFKSLNGGTSWENTSEGMTTLDVREIVIDPSNTNVVYAGTWGGGVFLSIDGGLNWRDMNNGLGSACVVTLALDPGDPNTLYAGGGTYNPGLWRYVREAGCPAAEILSYNPTFVNVDNCSTHCDVDFYVGPQENYLEVAKITLERHLATFWVTEDSIVAPEPGPEWKLTCHFDEHFTDGPHEFRAVYFCRDGASSVSNIVTVIADRGIPVAISSFESRYSNGGVRLTWSISDALGFQGFNVYRSLGGDGGFRRINSVLIPATDGNDYIDNNVEPGRTYWYRLGAVDNNGELLSQTISAMIPALALELFQNHPNPFGQTTTISFVVPGRSLVTLSIYDVNGRLVRTVVRSTLEPGFKEIVWDGRDTRGNPASSGVYFYSLTSGKRRLTKKLVFLR